MHQFSLYVHCGFLRNGHYDFKYVNKWLQENDMDVIDWTVWHLNLS
jgi:uracil DNA glycosylase